MLVRYPLHFPQIKAQEQKIKTKKQKEGEKRWGKIHGAFVSMTDK